jgi:hypothetical protein
MGGIDMRINPEELLHAELEALKNSVVMLEINKLGKVANRILVHKKDIQHFKNLGYAENIKEGYDPQIGHDIDFRHIDLRKDTKQLIKNAIVKELNLWNKIKFYFKQLFGMK